MGNTFYSVRFSFCFHLQHHITAPRKTDKNYTEGFMSSGMIKNGKSVSMYIKCIFCLTKKPNYNPLLNPRDYTVYM